MSNQHGGFCRKNAAEYHSVSDLNMDFGSGGLRGCLVVAGRLVLVGPALRQEALRLWKRVHVQRVDGHL